MLKTLDIDNNIYSWIPAFTDVKNNRNTKCPLCGSSEIDAEVHDLGDKIGYVLISCNKCGKSGYFSRVDLSGFKGKIIKNAV